MSGKERPGAIGTSSIGMPYMVVTVDSLDGDYAMVSDQFRNRRQIDLRVRRGKFPGPAVGESWIIDRVLGVWSFAAIVNYAGGGAALVGPTFSYPGSLYAAVSGLYVVQTAMRITKIVLSGVTQTHSEATVKLMDGDMTFNITLWTGALPTDTLTRAYTVSIDLTPGNTLFVAASSAFAPRPLNITIQTVVEAV